MDSQPLSIADGDDWQRNVYLRTIELTPINPSFVLDRRRPIHTFTLFNRAFPNRRSPKIGLHKKLIHWSFDRQKQQQQRHQDKLQEGGRNVPWIVSSIVVVHFIVVLQDTLHKSLYPVYLHFKFTYTTCRALCSKPTILIAITDQPAATVSLQRTRRDSFTVQN